MAVDLTGGLGGEREYVFAKRPDDPEMRESVNAWIWDGGSEVGMPRIGIEAVGATWESHQVQLNVAHADGRVFNHWAAGRSHPPFGADARPRTWDGESANGMLERSMPSAKVRIG